MVRWRYLHKKERRRRKEGEEEEGQGGMMASVERGRQAALRYAGALRLRGNNTCAVGRGSAA